MFIELLWTIFKEAVLQMWKFFSYPGRISSSVVFIPFVYRKLKSARVIVKHSLFKLIHFIVTPPCCLCLVLFLELIKYQLELDAFDSSEGKYQFVQICTNVWSKKGKGTCVLCFIYETKLKNKNSKIYWRTDGNYTQVYRSYHVNTVYVPSSKVYQNLRIAAIICHWYIVNNTCGPAFVLKAMPYCVLHVR